MGKLGPLTSQALGRSPYDDVVIGDGEGDIRAPVQLYDERGRPVNPDTKRINKDVIRSHNEVMLVIGVAEPENTADELKVEAVRRRKHDQRDDDVGRVLLNVGRALEIGGVWGVNGLRQRILLYRQYANVPFYDLFKYEHTQRSASSILLTGLPAFALNHALKQISFSFGICQKNFFLRSALTYVRMHLQIWVFMQRMGLIPSSSWFPRWRYFIPFSNASPIPAPPPLTSLTPASVVQWVGGVALSMAPFAAFWAYSRLWTYVTRNVWLRIYDRMPSPINRKAFTTNRLSQVNATETLPEAAAASLRDLAGDAQARNAREIARESVEGIIRDEATIRALEGQAPPSADAIPVGAIRRQSTFSSRGDEYVSDDEETEVVSATLISFDVEATESTDTPTTGFWSAELRPNTSGEQGTVRQEPLYRDNALTRLPSVIATDILTVVSSYILIAPYEAFALRFLARSWRMQHGLPIADIYDLSPIRSFSWTAVANFLGLELCHLVIESELWASMVMLATSFSISEEDWNKTQEAEANESNE